MDYSALSKRSINNDRRAKEKKKKEKWHYLSVDEKREITVRYTYYYIM